jgi:rhodanese-related sulfurtransferase
MTIAVTGANERSLKEAGIPFARTYTTSGSHAGYYPGATSMNVKLLFRVPDGRLLGAQLTGFDGVDKRCDVFATAIAAKMTVHDLTDLELAYAPPYGSAKDPVNMAGYVASNLLDGTDRQFTWDEVASLDLSKVTLLDVRTEDEFISGSIPGAVNIPLDELRERLSELDASRPVYEFCRIGLRGHIAYRILAQSGFPEVYNLAGGFRFYEAATRPFPLTPSSRGNA